MTHFDVSFLDLNGNERSHYDGKAVGENLHACNSLSSTHTGTGLSPMNQRMETVFLSMSLEVNKTTIQ